MLYIYTYVYIYLCIYIYKLVIYLKNLFLVTFIDSHFSSQVFVMFINTFHLFIVVNLMAVLGGSKDRCA